MRKGISVSPGVAIGTAYCINEVFVATDSKRLVDEEVSQELARYETARDRAAADLRARYKKVAAQVGEKEASIFQVHEAIIRDAAFTKKVRDWIVNDRLSAPASLQRLLEEYAALFARANDEYLQDRLNDIRDVIEQLSGHLSDVLQVNSEALPGPLIVVADELLPSQVVTLGPVDVHGIVTEQGSQTSHAAIVARSRGIPAVCGVRGMLRQVSTGDTIVVDGRSGHVLVNPDAETLAAFRKLEREFFHLKDELAANRDQPAKSADGQHIELMANINGLVDIKAANAMGAVGVGLFRTEYLYLTHPDVPDEEEQLEVYRQIVESSPPEGVTIRTLDIGGDKTVPYLGHHHQEANPFMGWRSIRLSFQHPEFFSTQIRAILRAAACGQPGKVKMMFPMVTTLEEIRRLRKLVKSACRKLSSEKKKYAEVPIGMMLEVPAAAIMIEDMLAAVDFVSIGSNDLVQYLMAADRDNPKVSHLCQPLAPAVLRVLSSVISAANQQDVPITLCGEMAGQPEAFLVLMGMGLRTFSMSSAFIPSIKEFAGKLSIPRAQRALKRALKLKTTAQVKRFLTSEVRDIAPDLAPFLSN